MNGQSILIGLLKFLGFGLQRTSYKDKLISTAGGFLGIFAVYSLSFWLLDAESAVYIVPSMGATAVLLFAAPHVPFSQPWNVFGGHLISAFVGVACWSFIPDLVVAASASVGVSIGLMYFSRCIHPPGGATALAAVIGGEKIHALGYLYLVEPVLLNTLTLLIIAIAFNRPFEWRRYPAYTPAKQQALVSGGVYEPVKHEDFVFALSQIDTFVDINEEDLLKIYALATKPQQEPGSDQSPSGRS